MFNIRKIVALTWAATIILSPTIGVHAQVVTESGVVEENGTEADLSEFGFASLDGSETAFDRIEEDGSEAEESMPSPQPSNIDDNMDVQDFDTAEDLAEFGPETAAAVEEEDSSDESLVVELPDVEGTEKLFLPLIEGTDNGDVEEVGTVQASSMATASSTASNNGSYGDFNGDGYDDLAIGVPFEDVAGVADAGAVNVIYGSADGLDADAVQDQFWHQDTAGVPGVGDNGDRDRFGWTVAAGNFNNDRYDDLLIGSPFEHLPGKSDAGAVTILLGSANGLTAAGSQLWTQDTPGVLGVAGAGDQFGRTAVVGDFNNDGFDDAAISAPRDDVSGILNAGVVNVLLGSATGLTAAGDGYFHQNAPLIGGAANQGDEFGFALAACDFNNDGRDDLAIGVPNEDFGGQNNRGVAHVLYGAATGVTGVGSTMWHQNSAGILGVAQASDFFGRALTAGDFDNDGFCDLIVSVPYEDFSGRTNAGAIHALYGRASGISAANNQLWTQNSAGIGEVADNGDRFGWAVAAGDFNNDGSDDVAIGVPYEDIAGVTDAGAVNVIYGSANRLNAAGDQFWSQRPAGIQGAIEVQDRFGMALTVGDYDGNRADDLAISVPYEDLKVADDKINVGAVNVIYGVPSGLTALGDQIWHQDSAGIKDVADKNDFFGYVNQ